MYLANTPGRQNYEIRKTKREEINTAQNALHLHLFVTTCNPNCKPFSILYKHLHFCENYVRVCVLYILFTKDATRLLIVVIDLED